MVAPAHNHTENCKILQELTLWMGTGFTRPHGGRLMILPVDQNAGTLPRPTWIDVCAASTSVLHRDPPQELAKEQNGAAAADRTPTPKSVTEPPNTKSNTQELSRNREPVLSQYTQELASVKKTI